MRASNRHRPFNRRRRQSTAAHRVVHVRTGLLSQTLQGGKWLERATRKCPIQRAHSSGETGSHRPLETVVWASSCRNPANRRRQHSPATRRVVRVRTGLLSQILQGEKRQERATRTCRIYRASGREGFNLNRLGSIALHRPSSAAATGPWRDVELKAAFVLAEVIAALVYRKGQARTRQPKDRGDGEGLLRDQGYNRRFVRMNGAAHLASRHGSSGCYRH